MLHFYQHLPEYINPIAFSFGFFSIRWYSIMYLASFAVVWSFLMFRIKKREGFFTEKQLLDWIFYAILGLLIGGRLGYVVFYNPGFYFHHPLAIISPYDFSSGVFVGIFGMSYFGGAIGVFFGSLIFSRKYQINFWQWFDFIIPAIPAGYFFGRIGNFLNGELYGRITERSWGMYFPANSFNLRHPSQLYEALFEGLILFIILWSLRRKIKFPGELVSIYLMIYGLFRFGIEFWREPDHGVELIFGILTTGQMLSLVFIVVSLGISITWLGRKKEI